jgi:hypothetical protein
MKFSRFEGAIDLGDEVMRYGALTPLCQLGPVAATGPRTRWVNGAICAQAQHLAELGCDVGQGYDLGHPTTAANITRLLTGR